MLDLRLKRCEQSISKMDFKMSNVMKTLQTTKHSIARVHLLHKIKDQVEFYFSDANLINDIFLLKHMYKSGNEQDNWVSLKVLGTFQKIKKLVGGPNSKKNAKVGKATLASALQFSSLLVLDPTQSLVKRTVKMSGFNVYQLLSRSVVVRKLSPTMITAPAVRSKIVDKCKSGGCAWAQNVPGKQGGTAALIERIVFVSGKETPQDVLREAYKVTTTTTTSASANDNDNTTDDVRGVDARRDRSACVIVVLESTAIAYDLVRNLDEPNNWRGGMRVEMMSGEKVHPVHRGGTTRVELQQQQQQQQQQQPSSTARSTATTTALSGMSKEEDKQRQQQVEDYNIKQQAAKVVKLAKIAKRKEDNLKRQLENDYKEQQANHEDNDVCTNVTGVVLVCKHSDRYGFLGRSIYQKKGTYFQFQHILAAPFEIESKISWTGNNDRHEAESTKYNRSSTSSNGKNITLRRGDYVTYDIVLDRKSNKLRAQNVQFLVGVENALDVAKRNKINMLKEQEKRRKEEREEREEEQRKRYEERNQRNGRHPQQQQQQPPRRQFVNEAESNSERIKYLRERKLKLSGASSSAKGGAEGQKTGNRRNQFGENVEAPTTSGVLLDIVGRDVGGMVKSGGGEKPVVWKIQTAKGPDDTRGFSQEYQQSRGRMVRSLSVDAVEFVFTPGN